MMSEELPQASLGSDRKDHYLTMSLLRLLTCDVHISC